MLAVCSEADAFIASSLTQFSLTARLAFMVVGPGVDVTLLAMQIGTFGRHLALGFAPLPFVVALLATGLSGLPALGVAGSDHRGARRDAACAGVLLGRPGDATLPVLSAHAVTAVAQPSNP